MTWITVDDKLFPHSPNIPADVEPLLPDPEHPELPHHTPCQIAWRRQIISRLYFNRLVDKTMDPLKHRYSRIKDQEKKRKQRWIEQRMKEGPPQRPPGIVVPKDIIWKRLLQGGEMQEENNEVIGVVE